MNIPTDHRPWPIPSRPWLMGMRWLDLLFVHWPADPGILRKLIPASLELDLFDGRAYIGAVPFLMEDVAPRCVPGIPGLHAFPELNLRTYVTAGGKPGVWFFSLDAGQKLAVRAARRLFHLPYFDAKFDVKNVGETIDYSSQRTHRDAPEARFIASYRPIGTTYQATPRTLDHWLTERYCLYSADPAGQIYRGEIHHKPWLLQAATAEVKTNTLGDWLAIEMNGPPATLHFAKSLDVRAWMLSPI